MQSQSPRHYHRQPATWYHPILAVGLLARNSRQVANWDGQTHCCGDGERKSFGNTVAVKTPRCLAIELSLHGGERIRCFSWPVASRHFRCPYVLWLIVVSGLLSACGCRGNAETATDETRPKVRVTRPIVREVTEYTYFTGRTDAIASVDLKSRVSGYLDSVDFVPGTEVKAGQQLFKIDPRPYQAVFDAAMGQVKLAEARLTLAEADQSRAKKIAETPGAISQQDLDKYAAAEEQSRAALDAAKADAETARLNLEFTTIKSPIDGLIGRNFPSIGSLIRQDDTLLATVVTQDPMYAYFDVDEHTMLRFERLIREGKIRTMEQGGTFVVQMGLADEEDQYPHQGEIDFANNRVNSSTGTLEVRGVFPNPKSVDGERRLLKPGMFVRTRVPIGQPFEALLVPEAAIGTDQGRKYLLVVNDNSVVEARVVELGPQQPGGMQVVFPTKMVRTKDGLRPADETAAAGAEVKDSLQASDRIIVGGLQLVRPGVSVDATEIASEPTAVTATPRELTPTPASDNSRAHATPTSVPAAEGVQ